MIDVHAPHEAAHTWTDFFIHIATIVVGLLIAIGLEQIVEYVHHRDMAREASEQLLQEREFNEQSNRVNIFTTERHQQDLRRDLAILRALRTHAPLPPGPFIVRRYRYLYAEDVWLKVHQTGTINYLTGNVGGLAYRYQNQEAFLSRATESTEALSHAAAVLRSENDVPQTSWDSMNASAQFLKVIANHKEAPDESFIQKGYADLAEHSDLTQLTSEQIAGLEQAIKIALNDDDALLTDCFNIKRNLQNNPRK